MESKDVCINSYDIVLCFHNIDLDNTLCLVNGFLTEIRYFIKNTENCAFKNL